MEVEISIVIVSWNVKDLLEDCITPFYNKENIEIIIVDNNSWDGTQELIKNKYSNIIFIENKFNNGFSLGNNQGFKLSNGKYIYILNPDTYSSFTDLMKLKNVLDNNERVGGVGPKLVYGSGEIQKSCARKFPSISSYLLINTLKLDKLYYLGNFFEKRLKYPYNYNKSSIIECCSGAAYFVRKKIIDDLGGFSGEFIHTGEDVELMFRVRKIGYENFYCSDSILKHYTGQSSKQALVRIRINSMLSTYTYFLKTKGKLHAIIYKSILFFIERPVTIFIAFLKLIKLNKKNFQRLSDEYRITIGLLKWKKID